MMKNRGGSTAGVVYSTELGRMCPDCLQAVAKCTCKKKSAVVAPVDGFVRVSRETKGRGGKGVTLVKGLPLEHDELSELGKLLKATCGAGGTTKDGIIAIQGDHRVLVMDMLKQQGWKVKAAGG
jgi:translation initiation factor 1